MGSSSWPSKGGGGGVLTFPNFGAFPPTAPDGTLAIDLSTNILYVFDATTGTWIPIASPSSFNAITQLTGDVTAIGPGVAVATLATVNANIGTFGTASSVGSFTVNAKGLTTAASNISIQITEAQVTGLIADLAGKQGVITIGALDAQPANATGLSLVANVLSTQSANGLFPGLVNTIAQTFAGVKSFSSDVVLSNALYNNSSVGQSLAYNSSTGILSGGNLTINADPTKFNVSAGTGRVIDYSNPSAISITNVSWGPFIAVTTLGLTTADFTFVMVDSAGALFQLNTYPTQSQRRQFIFLGRLSHANRTTLTFANAIPDYSQSVGAQLYDLFDALGPFNIAGNLISPNGANLTFQVSAGQIFFRAFNYPTTTNNPNVVNLTAHAPLTFNYALQSGTFFAPTTIVDVTNYDTGLPSPTPIPNPVATATIQRVFVLPTGNYIIQYGQTIYSNLATAQAAIGVDPFVINPALTNTGVLIGYIIAQKNTVALNNTTTALLTNAPRFSVNGGGGVNQVVSLQQTYNSSIAPQIVLNSTQGGLQVTDNATPLGTSLFSLSNSALTTKYLDVDSSGVSAAGKMVASTIVVPGFRTQATTNTTITLTVTDAQQQVFTGTTAGQIVKLPTTSIIAGTQYDILNDSNITVTVQSSGSNTILVAPAGSRNKFTALIATPTTAAHWDITPSLTSTATSGITATIFPGSLQSATLNVGSTTTSVGAAWTAYTPTVTALTGTLTTASATGRYQQLGKTVFFQQEITITTNGTGSNGIGASLPPSLSAAARATSSGVERSVTGKMLSGQISNASATNVITYYDGTYPGANGANFVMSGVYESL